MAVQFSLYDKYNFSMSILSLIRLTWVAQYIFLFTQGDIDKSTISNCEFENNTATTYGQVIYN